MRITGILLTRYFKNDADFHEWCQHHFLLGFDHIHVFDDGTEFDLKTVCKEYCDSISYERVYNPQQYQLYNRYIPECDADFVMPIDDDEYLWISPELGNIKNTIAHYTSKFPDMDVLGVRWQYMFPKVFHTERQGAVLDYCTEKNDYLATRFTGYGNDIIKCIVRKDAFVRYIDADESMIRNHIPMTTGIDGARLCNGHITRKQWVSGNMDDEWLRLLHCPYKGYSEYIRKQKQHYTVSRREQKKRNYDAFNIILDRLP